MALHLDIEHMLSIRVGKTCEICKKVVWYIRGRTRYGKRTKGGQKGKGLPIELIASAAAPFIGETAKSIFKKIFGGRRTRRK